MNIKKAYNILTNYKYNYKYKDTLDININDITLDISIMTDKIFYQSINVISYTPIFIQKYHKYIGLIFKMYYHPTIKHIITNYKNVYYSDNISKKYYYTNEYYTFKYYKNHILIIHNNSNLYYYKFNIYIYKTNFLYNFDIYKKKLIYYIYNNLVFNII